MTTITIPLNENTITDREEPVQSGTKTAVNSNHYFVYPQTIENLADIEHWTTVVDFRNMPGGGVDLDELLENM